MDNEKKPWEMSPKELAKLMAEGYWNSNKKKDDDDESQTEVERILRDADDGYFEDD